MSILYYDCFSGISGDMNLAAMIDLGVPAEHLQSELNKLHLSGYEIKISKDSRHGIFGTRVDVVLAVHHHQKQSHHHEHRGIIEIRQIIGNSQLSPIIKKTSMDIFEKIAVAESKIHNKGIDDIHFHEVGAIDSIIDIVGAAICIDYLKPDKIMASSVQLGGGFVECEHGTFPVPAPATAEILQHIPVKTGAVPFETTTPTGAAILATLVNEFTDHANFIIEKTAYGIGHKDAEIPNVLRVYQAHESISTKPEDRSLMIECNIDDMNPESYEYIMEQLLYMGIHDVFLENIIMKKSRPAVKLSVLCSAQRSNEIIQFLLKETSTLGVRFYEVNRTILDRTVKNVETSIGSVKIKYSALNNKIIKAKPEYDDCVRISREKSIPLLEVIRLINKEITF